MIQLHIPNRAGSTFSKQGTVNLRSLEVEENIKRAMSNRNKKRTESHFLTTLLTAVTL